MNAFVNMTVLFINGKYDFIKLTIYNSYLTHLDSNFSNNSDSKHRNLKSN